MSRRSTRLAAKPSIGYMEDAPTTAEQGAYACTLTRLLANVELFPYMSVERVQAAERVFHAVMVDHGTALGSRMIAHFPRLRRDIRKALDQCQDDCKVNPVLLARMREVRTRYYAFLSGVRLEICYRP